MNSISAKMGERVELDQPKCSRGVARGYALVTPKAFERLLCTPWYQTTSETKRTICQRGRLSGLGEHGEKWHGICGRLGGARGQDGGSLVEKSLREERRIT